jgi:hypothetical protein
LAGEAEQESLDPKVLLFCTVCIIELQKVPKTCTVSYSGNRGCAPRKRMAF